MKRSLNMKLIFLITLLTPNLFAQTIPNTKYKSYRSGRAAMLKAHSSRKITLYCDCKYEGNRINSSCPIMELIDPKN